MEDSYNFSEQNRIDILLFSLVSQLLRAIATDDASQRKGNKYDQTLHMSYEELCPFRGSELLWRVNYVNSGFNTVAPILQSVPNPSLRRGIEKGGLFRRL